MTFASRLIAVLCLCGRLAAAPSGVWLDVPFVKQEQNGCGAASVAMVMQYWSNQTGRAAGSSAEASEIQRALYSPRARGIYASAMEHYLQTNGFRTFAFRGGWQDLAAHLAKGRPLIVALKTGNSTPLHYVVIVGVDAQEQLVLLNDPAERKLLKRQRSSFEKQWRDANNWTLLALPQQAGN